METVLYFVFAGIGLLCAIAGSDEDLDINGRPLFGIIAVIFGILAGLCLGQDIFHQTHFEVSEKPQIDSIVTVHGADTTKVYIIDIIENEE